MLWTFAWFVRPLLATILCIMGNLVPAYHVSCITYFPVGQKKKEKRLQPPPPKNIKIKIKSASLHWFGSRPMTRNQRLFCLRKVWKSIHNLYVLATLVKNFCLHVYLLFTCLPFCLHVYLEMKALQAEMFS